MADGLFLQRSNSTGEKILWLHGYTMDHTIWTPVWKYFPGYDHLALDLPGHGQSRGWKNGETLADIACTIGTLAMEEHVDHIVGISLGGMIALQVAIAFPDKFKSLTLNAAPLGGGPQEPSARVKNQELRNLYVQKGKHPELDKLWMQWPPDIFKGAAAHPQLFSHLQSLVSAHSWQELGDTSMAYINNYVQAERDMKRIAAHTLILIGEEDMDAFKRTGEIMRRAIPDAKRVYIPGCGHLAMLEDKAQCAQHMHSHLLKSSKNILNNKHYEESIIGR